MRTASASTPQRARLLRRKLAFVRGHDHCGRTERFRNRLTKPTGEAATAPDFFTVTQLPDWAVAPEDEQELLAFTVALLLHRPAIDRELSGAKLAALADVVGEDMFDRLCDLALPDSIECAAADELPRPEDLQAIGHQWMHRAMPHVLAEPNASACDDAQARALCAAAYDLVAPSGACPS